MTVVLYYPNCDIFFPTCDAFWVQCPSIELDAKILPYLPQTDKEKIKDRRDSYISTWFTTINPDLLVKPDSFYFVISKDGKKIMLTDPYFPYSSQWSGWDYLKEIDQFDIDSVSDLNTRNEYTLLKNNERTDQI